MKLSMRRGNCSKSKYGDQVIFNDDGAQGDCGIWGLEDGG